MGAQSGDEAECLHLEDPAERLVGLAQSVYLLVDVGIAHNDAPPGALAVNDVVVNKWQTGRMLDFETSINGHYVNSHGGDGLVIATATGSTAYALSCGGPIVAPDLDAWVLAPISPNTWSARPIVVRAGSRILVRLADRLDARAQVTCDGAALGDLQQGDSLFVEGSDAKITLLHPPGYDYYRLLRSKLHWGRGGIGGIGGESSD